MTVYRLLVPRSIETSLIARANAKKTIATLAIDKAGLHGGANEALVAVAADADVDAEASVGAWARGAKPATDTIGLSELSELLRSVDEHNVSHATDADAAAAATTSPVASARAKRARTSGGASAATTETTKRTQPPPAASIFDADLSRLVNEFRFQLDDAAGTRVFYSYFGASDTV